MRRLVKSFLFAILCLSSLAYAKPKISTVSGELPRDPDATRFTVEMAITGVVEPLASGAVYASRVQIFIAGGTTYIPLEDLGPDANRDKVDFEMEHEEDSIVGDDDVTTVGIRFIIKETKAGALAEAIGADGELELEIDYLEKDDEAPTKEVTLSRVTKVANEAPSGVSVKGGFHMVIGKWSPETTIKFSEKTGTPTGMTLYAVKKSLGDSVSLSGMVFNADAPKDTEESECRVDTTVADGEECVSCDKVNAYLNDSDIASSFSSSKVNVASVSTNTGKMSSTGELTVGDEYMVFLAYRPDSLERSVCYTATPTTNTSFAEYYGEKDAKKGDPRCFIATAAYGSPLNKKVMLFRWFRDAYLAQSWLGRQMIEGYYRLSPPLAAFIDQHPGLKGSLKGSYICLLRL